MNENVRIDELQDFVVGREPMVSAADEAMKRKYRRADGKDGRIWLYAVQENSGDNVYVWADDPKSDGFGGRMLTFSLEDGEELNLRAPWQSNTDALFRETGVDLRDKHRTFGVVSLDRGSTGSPRYDTVMLGVIWRDEAPVVGAFDRVKLLAQKMADEMGRRLFYYARSQGGSSCGPIYPGGSSQ